MPSQSEAVGSDVNEWRDPGGHAWYAMPSPVYSSSHTSTEAMPTITSQARGCRAARRYPIMTLAVRIQSSSPRRFLQGPSRCRPALRPGSRELIAVGSRLRAEFHQAAAAIIKTTRHDVWYLEPAARQFGPAFPRRCASTLREQNAFTGTSPLRFESGARHPDIVPRMAAFGRFQHCVTVNRVFRHRASKRLPHQRVLSRLPREAGGIPVSCAVPHYGTVLLPAAFITAQR